MKIEINDDEVMDQIIVQLLKKEIKGLSKDISELKRKKKLKPHEKEDLENWSEYINALKIVCAYRTV
jgi:hypothetical protein